ncbi:HNH endonuclease [Streptomyces scopuliridis]|uniref:HNH endonuclease signature motif containing protein n=1 Tax=Streptomyces scopuliridis TaxID=452529 RepID=UPI0036AE10B6
MERDRELRMAGDARVTPESLGRGRTFGAPATAYALDADRMSSRREGMIGQFGMGLKSAMSLPTGTGKTATAMAVAIEAVRQGQRLTVVVKDNHAVAGFRAELEAVLAGLDEAAANTTAPDVLRLVPQPYAPRRWRARVSPSAEYRALCKRVVEWEESGRDQKRWEVAGDRRVRSSAARRAVIIRSGGRCENPECLLPDLPYRTKAGQPLLEVDHIDDHASGGRDHPAAMIALCPNCHRNKTHGADGAELVARLRGVASNLHTQWEDIG